jgi:DNA polymerase delta subunit 2
MEETPHIFFAGNQPEYSSRLVQGTLKGLTRLMTGEDGQLVQIVCVPKFSETGDIVLVNLSTLESETLRFSSGALQNVEMDSETKDENPMDDIAEL